MKQNSDYKVDIISGIVIAAFSVFYMSLIPSINRFTDMGSTPLTNHFAPKLWGGVLLVLGLWITVRGLRKRKRYILDGGGRVKTDFKSAISEKREVFASFVALILYVALMGPVGFVPMTILYLFIQIIILTPSDKWKKTIIPALIISVLCAILFYFIFRYKLNVLLPQGILKSFGL